MNISIENVLPVSAILLLVFAGAAVAFKKPIFTQKMELKTDIQLLLIDDDEDDRDFFRMALEEADYPVRCEFAESAKCGLDLLSQKEFCPDFIFLDLNMPGTDGRACLKALKATPHTNPIPVVIFSTSSEHGEVEETRKLGAMDFMTKPTNLDQLVHSINTFLKTNLNPSKQAT